MPLVENNLNEDKRADGKARVLQWSWEGTFHQGKAVTLLMDWL